MTYKPTLPAVQLDRNEAAVVSMPVVAAAASARPAKASGTGRAKESRGQFWFVFDQWLPAVGGGEDEFVLA